MTRRLLIEQLAKARAIGDRAATTMLLARIRAEERRNTAAALLSTSPDPLITGHARRHTGATRQPVSGSGAQQVGTAPSARPGGLAGRVGAMGPLSELELRWLHGDR